MKVPITNKYYFDTGDEMFHCELCGWAIPNEDEMIRHIAEHDYEIKEDLWKKQVIN